MSTCPLTETQIRIVQRLANGEPVKAIAHGVGRSSDNIYRNIQLARRRTKVATTEYLIAIALREGWIQ